MATINQLQKRLQTLEASRAGQAGGDGIDGLTERELDKLTQNLWIGLCRTDPAAAGEMLEQWPSLAAIAQPDQIKPGDRFVWTSSTGGYFSSEMAPVNSESELVPENS